MAWWIYAIIAAAVIFAAVGARLIWVAVLTKQGKYLSRQVTSKLKSFSSIRRYLILTDVRLPYRGDVKTISHILIGIFGVIVVDAHSFKGELYGSADDKKWMLVHKNGSKEQINSLVLDLQEKADAVRQAFAAKNLYKVDIDSVNIVQNSGKKLVLYVAENLPVIRFNRFGSFLAKTKYDKDLGVDMGKLAEIIKNASIMQE